MDRRLHAESVAGKAARFATEVDIHLPLHRSFRLSKKAACCLLESVIAPPYLIVQLPLTSSFIESTKLQLQNYFSWFFEIMPERLCILKKAVNSTPGYEKLTFDQSGASLLNLGEWFRGQAEGEHVDLSEAEKEAFSKFSAQESKFELTSRTLSIAFDIGMYFSQVIINSCEGLKWEQPLKNKKFVDYGQPVLVGKSIVPCNPSRLVISVAYGFALYNEPSTALFELFEIWSKSIMSA